MINLKSIGKYIYLSLRLKIRKDPADYPSEDPSEAATLANTD